MANNLVGFAKLQGEEFEYYMQTYSIILGRGNNQFDVDVDLSLLSDGVGGKNNISRKHAVIYYDFAKKIFALEVLGKNGCFVEGVMHMPGDPPVKLDSQNLLQIGGIRFYFLLPTRSIFKGGVGARRIMAEHGYNSRIDEMDVDNDDDDDADEEEKDEDMPLQKLGGKRQARSMTNREADNLQLLQLEEKNVISCVANMLSQLCGPGECMPMSSLHDKLAEQYGNIWHHSRVRKYLTSEEWPDSKTNGKPWYGLLILLRKYREHFVITTRSRGRVKTEFVALVSPVS